MESEQELKGKMAMELEQEMKGVAMQQEPGATSGDRSSRWDAARG